MCREYDGDGVFEYPQESALNIVVIEAPVVRTVKTLRAILQPEPLAGSELQTRGRGRAPFWKPRVVPIRIPRRRAAGA